MATTGWLRGSALTALAAALIAATAAWRSPGPAPAMTDPSLVLGALNPVPAPVMGVLRRGCFDCHSNETRWPWYARVPPSSWLVVRDVERGRGQMNFSWWGRYNPFDRADMLDRICNLVSKERMPPWQYRLAHAEARLSDHDVAILCDWSGAEATRLVNGGT